MRDLSVVIADWWHDICLNWLKSRYWPEMSCVISLRGQKYNKQKLSSPAHHHYLTSPSSLSKQQELEIFWQNSSGTTWLHFLLCYGHFCVIWPFCSLQNMGQCFHLDFFQIFTYFLFFNFRYQLIPHQKNTPALT